MKKIKWPILVFTPIAFLSIAMIALPGPAVAAPLLGITLTPTEAAPSATPITPTISPATPTPTDEVVPPNPTPTPTAQATDVPPDEEEEQPVKVTPSLPETGETPPGPPWQRLDWLGIFVAALIAFGGTLAYRKVTGSRRDS
jgi:hypothetical protein